MKLTNQMPGNQMTVSDWSNTDHAIISAWNRLRFFKTGSNQFRQVIITPRPRSTDCYVLMTVFDSILTRNSFKIKSVQNSEEMVISNQVPIFLPPTVITTNQHTFKDHVTNTEPIKFKEINKLLLRRLKWSIFDAHEVISDRYFQKDWPRFSLSLEFSISERVRHLVKN